MFKFVRNKANLKENNIIYNDTPPNSLINSTTNPKVKITKG
jgi:hypothetical protein